MFNTESVKELAHSNTTASAIFLAFSQRERGRHVINLDLIYTRLEAEGVRMSHTDYFGTFKRLEELDIGKLVYGRKGNANRFIWSYDLKDVAKIGLGNKDIDPKAIAPRQSRGVNKTNMAVSNVRPTTQEDTLESKQANVETKSTVKTPKVKATRKYTHKKYVNIKVPVELLEFLKTLK